MNSEAGPGRYLFQAAIRTCPRALVEFTPALELNGQWDKHQDESFSLYYNSIWNKNNKHNLSVNEIDFDSCYNGIIQGTGGVDFH